MKSAQAGTSITINETPISLGQRWRKRDLPCHADREIGVVTGIFSIDFGRPYLVSIEFGSERLKFEATVFVEWFEPAADQP